MDRSADAKGAQSRLRMWRPSVFTAQLFLVLLPLSVLGLQIYSNLRAANTERAAVQQIVPVVEDRVEVTLTVAALDEEVNWQAAAVEVEKLGVSNEVVIDQTGIDLDQIVANTAARSDAVLRPEFRDELAELRASTVDPLTLNRAYHELIDKIDADGRALSTKLVDLAVARPGGESVVRATRMVEMAAEAEIAIGGGWENWNGFRIETDPALAAIEMEKLISHRTDYIRAQAELRQGLVDTPLFERYVKVAGSDEVREFWALIDAEIEASLTSGTTATDENPISSTLENPGTIRELAPLLIESRQQWQNFTIDAGDEVIAAATDLEDTANRKIARNRNLLLMIGSLTLAATLLAARLISRSIRQLALSARSLRSDGASIASPTGPREVFLAGTAISEAGANFDLIRRQVVALSDGDIEHPDLAQVAPGRMGHSMKGVIDRLSNSIQERRALQAEAAWEATHDGLTGLPNRSAAVKYLEELLVDADAADVVVMFVDLDGFKTINDGHGHPVGDHLLQELSRRLRGLCRQHDRVSRIGGDEFVVILGAGTNTEEALRMGERVRDAMSESYTLPNGVPISVSASIGVTTSKPDSTVTSMLREADTAAYAAKGAGRNQVVLCTEELLAEADRTRELTTDILVAAEADQFRMEYQPIVNAAGEIVSLESLIRWDHPKLGLVMPDEFIANAERSEVITTVDRWVVQAVASQLAEWDAIHPELTDLKIAVNISSRHLNVPTFQSDILDPLVAHGIDPRRLTIEITETSLLENLELAGAQLRQLRERGVRVAIDDFGTGYSAITHLRYLPIDIIKIDRSFVANMTDPHGQEEALVRLCINTGQMLGATIVAEGVETPLQARMLTEMGAHHFQGWLYSRSIEPDEVPEFLEAWRAASVEEADLPPNDVVDHFSRNA